MHAAAVQLQTEWLLAVCGSSSGLTPCVFSGIGWRAEVLPRTHPVNELEFDVIIGADGRRNTLPGKSARTVWEKCISNAAFPLTKQGETQTALFVFSKRTWRLVRTIMISLVYSCGRVPDLTPVLTYE